MKKNIRQLTWSRRKDYALVADKAKFKRLQSSERSAFNIELKHARLYDASAKSVVERSFRILQVEFRALIPGYVRKESDKRNGPENQPVAVLRLVDSEQ